MNWKSLDYKGLSVLDEWCVKCFEDDSMLIKIKWKEKFTIRSGVAIGLLLTSFFASAAETISFTMKYSGGSKPSCDEAQNITGVEPADSNKHPVFIYTVGTDEKYDNAMAMAAVNGMAARGYVAATVQYPNILFGNCDKLKSRSQCVYNEANPASAVNTLCSRASADCSKGVVLGGFSQGALLATMAHDFNPNVQAVYGMGDGTTYVIYDLSSCMAAGNYSLSPDRLRLANGIHDDYLGPTAKGSNFQTRKVSGLDCPDGTKACYRPNGSGWYIIPDSEVEDGHADHCYQRHGGCVFGSQEKYLDEGWLTGTAPWELNANLDWLTQFTTP